MRSYAQTSLCTIAAVLLALPMTGSASAQQQGQSFECVKRTATAAPPPNPAGPPHAVATVKSRAGEEPKSEPAMKPLCPEGEVPVLKQAAEPQLAPQRQQPQKGNPLLRPRSGITPLARPSAAGAVSPGDVRSFQEIYGKPTKRPGAAPSLAPGPPPGPPTTCAGVLSFGSCYYYGSAGLTQTADGAGMTMSVDRPSYDNSGGPGHTLDEIAVQGGTGNGNIVELGWLVSSDLNGDSDPHIFVFHWMNWVPTCYNACNWQQHSNTYFPGQNINALTGHNVYVGYVFYDGNWWAWFNDQWMGYFPGMEWNNGYSKSALVQWFGEVASENGVPPKTQMGDGVLPPSSQAAEMATLCYVDAKAWVCWYRDQQSLSATVPKYYDIKRVGYGDTRYGGPGQ
jgi:hypothetical protein